MSDQVKKIIVVLGMHRSGTSAIARSLKLFGVELGNNLMQSVLDDNDLGFWEDNDIYEFNESLLKKINTTWHEVKTIDREYLLDGSLSRHMERALKLIKEKIIYAPVFGFKDPRTSILLPFWQQIFKKLNIQDSYVISIRNPLSVADSLYKRNGIDPEKSIQLWEKYLFSAIECTNNKNRVIVNYDRLLDNPELQLNRIARELNFKIKSDRLKDEYIHEFLRKPLRHNYYSLEDLKSNKNVHPFILQTYQLLDKLSQDEVEVDDHYFATEWKKIKRIYKQLEPIVKYIDSLNKKIEQTQDLVNERDKIIEYLNSIVAERDKKIEYLNGIVVERDEKIEYLNGIVVERDEKIKRLSKLTEEKSIVINEILSSNSWRLTHPFRKIKTLFFNNKSIDSK